MRRAPPTTESEEHRCYSSYLQSSWQAYVKRRRRPRSPENFIQSIMLVVPPAAKVIDIGASVGALTIFLRERGYDVDGIDGSEDIEQTTGGLVRQVDLVSDDCSSLFGQCDWGLFFDVGEHVPRKYEDILVANVARIPTVGLMVSWNASNVEQGDHVNLRDEADVVEMFGQYGWIKNYTMTKMCRRVLGRGWMARHRKPFVLLRK